MILVEVLDNISWFYTVANEYGVKWPLQSKAESLEQDQF